MVLYKLRVEPLRRDVKPKEVEDLLRDFGSIYKVIIRRASPYPRYNMLSKQKDIFDPTFATVFFTDSNARRMAILNMHNTLKHPITQKFHSIVENANLGQMEVRRSLRLYEDGTYAPLKL